jgi:hypothetical protein
MQLVRSNLAVSAEIVGNAVVMFGGPERSLDGVPDHAQEALRVRTIDDLNALEQQFMFDSRVPSDIVELFRIDKRKLADVTKELADRSAAVRDSLNAVVSLGPGQSCVFPVRFRAPVTTGPRTIPLHANVIWTDQAGTGYSVVARSKLSLRATPALMFLVAVACGPLGYLARQALSPIGLASVSRDNLVGCAILAGVMLAFALKSEKNPFPITVDGVAGAITIGALSGLFWESIMQVLRGAFPAAG